MYVKSASLALWLMAINGASAFAPVNTGVAFRTSLFADVAEETVPAEVEAMDGVESSDEAHNVERPARSSIKKKKPAGKDLSEFSEGSMVKGTIKSIASYGAFVDIGASTDGLLHVSQLSADFVSDVNDIVSEGQEVEVRIVKIDAGKGQVGLSMMTEEQAAASKPQRQPRRGGGRKDDSALLSALSEKGWDQTVMVEGTVVSTVDFGAFVKVDASALNSECEGTFDGLVHISCLKIGRVASVTDVVKPDDKVQVRCKSIDGRKVSLTMLSVEDEEAKAAEGGGRQSGGGFSDGLDPGDGAKDWKESVAKFDEDQPSFKNTPLIIRK
eukprot:CAMPEP_0116135622 /NCGR_PEP_ID=MMETSP0329-20121206/11286_1 /TAXON_ID=697910 /ORGANISM="Pseudo-nitzschia arenysensis, Strain B593" /LENGTH=326 /DNA_ID=CAMNT_0003630429 /DNA_START=166 /DNA_END=1146 /DNA_ORIENTATION=-